MYSYGVSIPVLIVFLIALVVTIAIAWPNTDSNVGNDLAFGFCQNNLVEANDTFYCDGKPFVCNFDTKKCYYIKTSEAYEKAKN